MVASSVLPMLWLSDGMMVRVMLVMCVWMWSSMMWRLSFLSLECFGPPMLSSLCGGDRRWACCMTLGSLLARMPVVWFECVGVVVT